MYEHGAPDSPLTERPSQPDDDLLHQAAGALADLLGSDRPPRWRILDRQLRPRSTIFPMEAFIGREAVPVFYKVEYVVSRPDSTKMEAERERRRRALEMESTLAERLSVEFKTRGFRFDQPLVIRPDLLTAVRLGVPGKQLGRPIGYAIPGRARMGRDLFRSIGVVARVIETVGRSTGTAFSTEECRASLLSDLALARPYLSTSAEARVAWLIDELLRQDDIGSYSAWTHGDLSPTNLLVHRGSLGVIDFSWKRGLAGRDLAHFRLRCETGHLATRLGNGRLMNALLEGYGAGGESSSLQLAYVERALRAVRNTRKRSVQAWGYSVLRGMQI